MLPSLSPSMALVVVLLAEVVEAVVADIVGSIKAAAAGEAPVAAEEAA